MEKYFDVNIPGCSIKCKLYCSDPNAIRYLTVFGHGFGGHKDNRAAARFAKRSLDKCRSSALVTFDWPCHGSDVRKTLLLSDCDLYLDAVLEAVRERFRPEGLYGYATSFGGYMFLKRLAEKGNPFRKLALRCPAVKMYETLMGLNVSPEDAARLQKGKPVEVGFDRKVRISREFTEALAAADITKYDYLPFCEDILILHGTKDEVVPFADTAEFADRNLIEFIPVENADHRFTDPDLMNTAISSILTFFAW